MSPRALFILAVLTACLQAVPRSAEAAPSSAEAAPSSAAIEASQREVEAGSAAYDAGDFTRALEHFKRAYELHPSPPYLYAWAQAARNAGDCATAIELYRRFIEAGATGVSLEAARQNEARCADELAARARTDEPVTPIPTEPAPSLPTFEPTTPDKTPVSERPPPPPDGLGLLLVVTGGAAAGAGAVLLGVAGARRATQANERSYQRFDELDPQIDRLAIAGGVTLGVGAALALAGGIRLGTRARRSRSGARRGGARQALVVPTLDAMGTPMVVVRWGSVIRPTRLR